MIKFRKTKEEDNFLLYVPNKKHNDWEIEKGRVKLIFYHDKTVEKFIRGLARKPRITDVTLDEIGSSIWKFINGENSVYDIGQKLQETYGDACDQIYERLIRYMSYLNKKGWIYFEKSVQ